MYDGSHESAGDLKKKYVSTRFSVTPATLSRPIHPRQSPWHSHSHASCVHPWHPHPRRIAKLRVALWEVENGIKFDKKKHQKKFTEMRPRSVVRYYFIYLVGDGVHCFC